MKLLIDPRLVAIPMDAVLSNSDLGDFWTLVVEWATDSRVVIGPNTLEYVWSLLDSHGYPERELAIYPRALRTEYRAALHTILARVAGHSGAAEDRTMHPTYLGHENERSCLARDASATHGDEVLGVATSLRHWGGEQNGYISFQPVPPSRLVLCSRPGEELEAEILSDVAAFYGDKKIHIVGGKPNDFIYKSIREALGISKRRIDWQPSEKNKVPRDLDKRYSQLSAERDIIVCVTNRIGHSQSEAAEKAASKVGVPYIPLESGNDIPAVLRNFAIGNL